MKLLKSLEEALYEIMVWLVFYPLTMWKVLTRPAAMMTYADDELDDAEDDRYSDKLSPPVFLALTLGLSHLLELAIGHPEKRTGFLSEETNLMIFRMVLFSVYPLTLAVRLLRRQHIALDRKTLRPPFYAQCYVAAPWAFVSSSALAIGYYVLGETVRALVAALGLIALAGVWYMTLQARWFARSLGISLWRGFGHALVTFAEATVLVLFVTAAVAAL